MSWLDESVKKEKDREKASEIRGAQHKIILQKKQHEFERLTPMVKQLLSDMGERTWGNFLSIKKYKVKYENGYEWRCMFKDIFHHGTSYPSWDVELKFTPEGNASHFVSRRDSTPDTSENELKKLLVKKFERGL